MTQELEGPLQLHFDRAKFGTQIKLPSDEAIRRMNEWRRKFDQAAVEIAELRIDVADLEDEVDQLEDEIDLLKAKLAEKENQ